MLTLAQFIAALKRIGAPVSNRDLIEKLYCYHVDAQYPSTPGRGWLVVSWDSRGGDYTEHCWIDVRDDKVLAAYNARHPSLPRGRIFDTVPF